MFNESTGVTIGGCYMVKPEFLAAKDREIEQLKAELDSKTANVRVLRSCIATPDEWRERFHSAYEENISLRRRVDKLGTANTKLEKDIAHLRDRIADGEGGGSELRARLNEVKKENVALKRLMNDRGTYDKSMIESFDERTSEELAKFVEFELANGGKTTFAAACLVLMWLKYEQQKAANQITSERIANAAAVIASLHKEIADDVAVTN